MMTMEKKLNNTNWELEKLSDTQLEKVAGGFMTMYLFLYLNDPANPNMVYWCKAPFELGLSSDPISFAEKFLINNSGWIFNQGDNSKYTSYDDFRKYVQSFANDNASHWSAPSTWGNLVFSAGMNGCERFEA